MGVYVEPSTKEINSNTPVFIEYDLTRITNNLNLLEYINQIYNPYFARLLTTDIEILKEKGSQEEENEHEELEEDQELPHLIVSI